MTDIYRELLLGCGHRREKLMGIPGCPLEWRNLYTLDNNKECKPDFVCDLDDHAPYVTEFNRDAEGIVEPDGEFVGNAFDEVHAYEVLEHLGSQGSAFSFFATFSFIWEILKPDGYLFATCPSRFSPWAWGDPSHRRLIQPESLVFLSQDQYKKQCDGPNRTPMSDFRHIYKADFDIVHSADNHETHMFALKAVKPSRIGK